MYVLFFLNSIVKFGLKKWLLYVWGYLCVCFLIFFYGFFLECVFFSVDFVGSLE